jgi:hypothetical protein
MTSMTPDEARQRQEARQVDLDTYRQGHPDSEPIPSADQALAGQATNRSRLDPAFGAAWSLLSGGFAVLACDPGGRPLPGAEPVTETGPLMSTWDRYPGAVGAAACGQPYDLAAIAVDDDGSEWLTKVAIDPATRDRPGPQKPPPSSTPFGDYREPGDPRPGPQRRELAGTAIRLIEVVAPTPRMAAATSGPGDRAESWGEDLGRQLRRPTAAVRLVYAWAWPLPENGKTWTLPAGRRVRAGVECLAALPGDGVVLELDGTQFRVSWGSGLARRQPMPPWLAGALGGRLR